MERVVGVIFLLLCLVATIFGGVGWCTGNIWAATTCGGGAGVVLFGYSIIPVKS
jgi:hypothetical protein